jgi:CheY-like chemotaxis protein
MESHTGAQADSHSSSTKTVLAVDDAPENLAFIKACLASAGYTVFVAKSGEECLTLLTRLTPRLILLDVQMPGIDGFETCRLIRKRKDLAAVPVAFLTARKGSEDVKECVAAGGNDFIVKPFDRQRLLDRVGHWTTHRPAARAAV